MPLDFPQIVNAAIEVIDAKGLEKLSLRTLASKLGVQAPSLYWYIKSKSELLNFLAISIFQKALESVPPTENWQDWIEAFGRIYHDLLVAQRDGALLSASFSPGVEHAAEGFSHACRPLMELGLSREQALMYQGSIIAFCTGWALHEQQDGLRESLEAVIDIDKSFDIGLKALVSGFAAHANT